jgi:hypothetical protein
MVTYLTGRNYSLTKRRLVSVSLATAIVVSWPTKAEHISFIGGEIPYVFHQKQTGPHNEFYQHVIQQSMVSHEIKFLPYRRAMRDFSVRRADCLYVATDTKEDYPQEAIAKNEIVFSDPINSINLHAYTRLDESAIKSMSDLKGKVIAGARSHLKKLTSVAKASPDKVVVDTADHVKAFDLLKRGRVDMVIAYEFDRARSETARNFSKHNFDQNFIIETTNEVVACWASVDTTGFIKTLNAKIKNLHQTSKLEKMFDPVALKNNKHSVH